VPNALLHNFLITKVRTLASRAMRLTRLTPAMVGLRSANRRFAPPQAHFDAVNRRLKKIGQVTRRRVATTIRQIGRRDPQRTLADIALVEREVDRARRAFGMFFEVFSQRTSAFAPTLAAHDAIAADCYAAVRRGAPQIFTGKLLKPITYMEHGYSPATMRRGVTLARLLGERNPFPLIRIPWDRDNPWQATFLHECSHNLQADMAVWEPNKKAVMKRLIRVDGDPMVVSTIGRWHKEIFADLASCLLGGPACAWGMTDFLAHPAPRTLTFKPGGVHPTGYFRVLILSEMLRRMGFAKDGASLTAVWRKLFKLDRGHRLPGKLLSKQNRWIPAVVDEIAFQTRRALGQRALADIIRFTKEDETRIRNAAGLLVHGKVPDGIPPRFLVSASRYALSAGADPNELSRAVIEHLSDSSAQRQSKLNNLVMLAA